MCTDSKLRHFFKTSYRGWGSTQNIILVHYTMLLHYYKQHYYSVLVHINLKYLSKSVNEYIRIYSLFI